jgi:hypothetical protein
VLFSFQRELEVRVAKPLNRVSASSVRWVLTNVRHPLPLATSSICSITPALPVEGLAQARGVTPASAFPTRSATTADLSEQSLRASRWG